MSTESLWNQNLLARYAHLPMAEERQQFLQHKLDEGSSWSSLRQLGIYLAAACFADAAHIREPSYPEGYRYCCESMGEPGTPCEQTH